MKKINLGIVAHVDAGKTTITEQLLYRTGARRTLGSVDSGTAISDFLQVERERGISVKASSVAVETAEASVNIIDTPGHIDFITEVERSLAAMDAAVLVVSAAEGVQAQTETLFKALRDTNTNVVVFINKIDRAGSDVAGTLAQIRELLNDDVLLFSQAIAEGDKGASVAARDFSQAEFAAEAADVLSRHDDVLLERYIGGDKITAAMLEQSLRQMVRGNKVVPVLLGSAMYGVGVEELLAFITRYLEPHKNVQSDNPLAIVYKITHEKDSGRIAHVRMFGGSLKKRDLITLGEQQNKITRILKYQGSRSSDMESVSAGDIAALCGLSNARVFDIIGEAHELAGVRVSQPLLRAKVIPADEEQLFAVHSAFEELSAEDPQLEITFNREVKELIVNITGAIQTEILVALVKERYGLDVTFSAPSVIYKETPSSAARGFEAYTMPKPCWAVIELWIEPLPRGSGYQFESVVNNNQMYYRYQTHVETCVPRALKQGVYNWEVIDLKVTLIGGEHHTIHTHPMDFFLATPLAVINGLQNAGTTLLEPIRTLRISAAEEFVGKVTGDVINMRGTFDTPVFAKGSFTMEAQVPVATSMDYAIRLASMTSGRGTLSHKFHSYQPCSLELGAVAARVGVDPRDRAKWILHHRQAL